MTMKELKQSETRTIKRSQINLNPINPKRHSDERVKLQKNLQKVGFLGGIVWNESTGNLVDGHRRIKAMDLYYKYDGSPETDYDVKVEVVDFDGKTEKEQLAYMAVGNTKPDIDLLADFVPDIDYSEIGLDANELDEILAISQADVKSLSESLDELIAPVGFDTEGSSLSDDIQQSYDAKKEHMRDVKQQVREQALQRQQECDAYITLSFSSFNAKSDFCDLMGISTDSKFAKGEDLLKLIK